jgi:hypothetical protein
MVFGVDLDWTDHSLEAANLGQGITERPRHRGETGSSVSAENSWARCTKH